MVLSKVEDEEYVLFGGNIAVAAAPCHKLIKYPWVILVEGFKTQQTVIDYF